VSWDLGIIWPRIQVIRLVGGSRPILYENVIGPGQVPLEKNKCKIGNHSHIRNPGPQANMKEETTTYKYQALLRLPGILKSLFLVYKGAFASKLCASIAAGRLPLSLPSFIPFDQLCRAQRRLPLRRVSDIPVSIDEASLIGSYSNYPTSATLGPSPRTICSSAGVIYRRRCRPQADN
jgi:hypothetical protein